MTEEEGSIDLGQFGGLSLASGNTTGTPEAPCMADLYMAMQGGGMEEGSEHGGGESSEDLVAPGCEAPQFLDASSCEASRSPRLADRSLSFARGSSAIGDASLSDKDREGEEEEDYPSMQRPLARNLRLSVPMSPVLSLPRP
eukprot:3094436-Rhodomonas_salina.2